MKPIEGGVSPSPVKIPEKKENSLAFMLPAGMKSLPFSGPSPQKQGVPELNFSNVKSSKVKGIYKPTKTTTPGPGQIESSFTGFGGSGSGGGMIEGGDRPKVGGKTKKAGVAADEPASQPSGEVQRRRRKRDEMAYAEVPKNDVTVEDVDGKAGNSKGVTSTPGNDESHRGGAVEDTSYLMGGGLEKRERDPIAGYDTGEKFFAAPGDDMEKSGGLVMGGRKAESFVQVLCRTHPVFSFLAVDSLTSPRILRVTALFLSFYVHMGISAGLVSTWSPRDPWSTASDIPSPLNVQFILSCVGTAVSSCLLMYVFAIITKTSPDKLNATRTTHQLEVTA
jgi:hypothetical protein